MKVHVHLENCQSLGENHDWGEMEFSVLPRINETILLGDTPEGDAKYEATVREVMHSGTAVFLAVEAVPIEAMPDRWWREAR